MNTNQKRIIVFFVCLNALFFACNKTKEAKKNNQKKPVKEEITNKKTNPCDSPKTVEDLLACANTIGMVDSIWVKTGSDYHQDCGKSWNAKDTVLTITYKDSITLWRVNEHKNTPGDYWGSWFTNYSAKAAGWTKAEVLNLFAMNPCPDEKNSWNTCKCINGKQPIDSVIQYEEKVKIGPNQRLLFGVVGQNAFGKGGPIQWHIINKKTPPFRLLEQIKWE